MNRKALPPIGLAAVLLGLWWALPTFSVINPYFLPTPQAVVARVVEEVGDGSYVSPLQVTLRESLFGCIAASAFGIPVGYMIAKSALFHRLISPYLAASQAIPAVAIAPLLTIWIGYGTAPVVVLCAIIVVFPVIVSTSVGIYHIDREIVGAARLDGASGLTLACKIELPLAAPSMLGGLRTGFTLSITGAVVGEMVTGAQGLGLRLMSAQHSGDMTGMFATITLLAICAMAIYGAIGWVERRIDFLEEPQRNS